MTQNTESHNSEVTDFFDTYRAALLARDEKAAAELYAVPSLILFPGQSVAVSSAAQTEEFFGGSWDQYEGVTELTNEIEVVKRTEFSVWADVLWHGPPADDEHFLYQLIKTDGGWRIAVLTPLE